MTQNYSANSKIFNGKGFTLSFISQKSEEAYTNIYTLINEHAISKITGYFLF
jgi:hypothetical protein